MSLSLDEFQPSTPEQWRAAAEESLKGAPFEKKLLTRTHEGITLQPIYDSSPAVEAWPGVAPFVRGGHSHPRPPFVAQEIPIGDPAEFNVAALDDLMRGQNALAIQLDVASRRGLDPSEADTPEVAACGLSLATLADARAAFRGIDPSAIEMFLWAGATALPVLGMLAAHSCEWRGAVVADPLGEYARDGSLPIALDDAFEEMAVAARWSAAGGVRLRTVGVNAGIWGDAGASSVEELAFAAATAATYLRELDARGIPPAEASRQFLFTYSVGSDVLIQIAKLRAARWLWARMLEACGAPAVPAFLFVRGTLFNKSWLDPHTNMLRATAEALAGALGGADAMHVAAFDETARVPDAFSRRIARNVHAILSEECLMAATADPAGGSHFIESATDELARKAWKIFQEVEGRGGMAATLRDGFPQKVAADVAARRIAAAATRRDGYIGVNLFPNTAEKPLPAPDNDARALHAARAAAVESARPHTLPRIERSVEAVADAFVSGATLGQIREALPRSAAIEPVIAALPVVRAASGYEALRSAANRHAKLHGNPPFAWLATFGPVKQHKARADFSAAFLAAGGFEIRQGPPASSAEEAAEAAIASKAPLVVLCSTDDTYPDLVAPFLEAFRARRPKTAVFLAGYPPDHVEAFQKAGIDGFLHLRANCLETLQQLHKTLHIGQ